MPMAGPVKKVLILVGGGLLIMGFWTVSGFAYAVSAVLLPSLAVILLTKLVKKLLGGATADAFKILLGALSVGAILFWVLQGSLATRLDVRLSGQAYEVHSSDKRLVLASFSIANTGSNNVSVESAVLTILPKTNGLVSGKSERLSTPDLGFAAGGNKDSIAKILRVDGNKYFLTWGTKETRQISQVLAAADYYDIYLEIEVAQKFPRSVSTWRAIAVVPTGAEKGRSPAFEDAESEKKRLKVSLKPS
jgi:hypothetical protein